LEHFKLQVTTITKLEGSCPIYSTQLSIPQSCLLAVTIVLLITRPVPKSILQTNILVKTEMTLNNDEVIKIFEEYAEEMCQH